MYLHNAAVLVQLKERIIPSQPTWQSKSIETNFLWTAAIYHGHVATWILRATSTTWAPSGHGHASHLCLSLRISILLQRVADSLRVGYPWIELSELAIFLLGLKGKMGQALKQQPRPQRDGAGKSVITACYQINKIFFKLILINIWNKLALIRLIILHNCVIISPVMVLIPLSITL